ncbi:hypothetical protein A4A49_37546 [Nicotiana attenuata]|uniref:S-protein homolog n=1 Tax=Nicotiana attenuata TaxID=49451 RepID=A0A1J6JSC8_NICAT|nr:hypothetical protein A4A49_37546 [Nicotiana attenuata]
MISFLVKIFFLLLIIPYDITESQCLFYEVHIFNNLPRNSPQLQLHCASGDDDFGHQYPGVRKDYSWSFCENWFPKTLYFCHFWWGFKEQAFEVFNNSNNCIDGGDKYVPDETTKCVWQIQKDGIYLGYVNSTGQLHLTKYAEWLGN